MIQDMPFRIASAFRLARARPWVERVNAWEEKVRPLSESALKNSARELRARLSLGETLDDLLPEAYALVREAAQRTIGQRHYDVQVLGAVAMHRGWIAEMQTGEGKTLTATMPAFLNALSGRGVHVVTVNDYLAKRDADWMGSIYRVLGLTVGCLVHGISDEERAAAYRADITYGTNKEFAFDYLRDLLRADAVRAGFAGGVIERMGAEAGARAGRVQREHNYAIVDEIDSILIDESRVPLIISDKMGEESPYADAYRAARALALDMAEGTHFTVDMPKRRVELTNAGIGTARDAADGFSTPPNRPVEHLVEQALKAEHLFERDREYLVMDGKVSIVDEFTGRVLADRTWSLGLHQAVEAKEGLTITAENRTLASVTFQRYFRLYRKLTGMTGTARDARREFWKVFSLRVATIPTNRPLNRKARPEVVCPTWGEKYATIADRIVAVRGQGRPVLVGTRSVQRSEELSRLLTERGIAHEVLNARNHAEEAKIIAKAGQSGRVTISTNMAGRGVDILLEPRSAEAGGLYVVGSEFHEARRVDRQLGGRCGRQGDPGDYEFFLCLEDEILWRWSKPAGRWLRRRAVRRGRTPPRWLCRIIFRHAQRRIESRHLRVRLDLLEYDEKLEEMKGSLGVPVWG